MFQVTRLAAGITKTTRKALKNVATGKIKLENASDSFNRFYNNNVKNLEYSKNIFKRAHAWVKDFINNFKEIKSAIKEMINEKTEELGKKFTRKDKKELKNNMFNLVNKTLKNIRTEIKELIKSAKAEKK